jgi:hypothetical protein
MAVKSFSTGCKWLFSLGQKERSVTDAAEKLQRSMRVTAKCRYNAAERLRWQGKFAFFTTTVLSLGLIFIPLMQNAGVFLAFRPNVLNMIQIFLAVAVLVYSVVIGTARYEMRAENLTECGNKLKELIRELDKARESKKNTLDEDLTTYQMRYSDVVIDSENHMRSDYRLAMAEMSNDYYISGFPRLINYALAYFERGIAFIVPFFMIGFEIIFITDMIGVSKILVPYFNLAPPMAE